MRWIAAVIVCGSVGGCSSSAYEAAYMKRVAEHRLAAEFVPLQPQGVSVAGGRAELRPPILLGTQLDGTETPVRATPPFLRDFPGFAAAYEAQVDATDGRFPVVLTVGVVPAAERRKDEVADAILAQVRQDESFRKAAWRKGHTLADEAAEVRQWDVLELTGVQPVLLNGAEERRPGRTEVWLSAAPGQQACVILAWRVPDDAQGKLPLPEMAELTARTVRITAP
jgi:hypothetical protein